MHDLPVRSQNEREAQTVVIATALLLFVVVVIIGTLVAWLLSFVVDLDDAQQEWAFGALFVVAGAIAVKHLVRRARAQ